MLALSSASTGAGTTAAMFGTLEMLGGGGASLMVSVLYNGTSRPMVTITLILFIAVLLLYVAKQIFGKAEQGS